jgi:hypothetical protein
MMSMLVTAIRQGVIPFNIIMSQPPVTIKRGPNPSSVYTFPFGPYSKCRDQAGSKSAKCRNPIPAHYILFRLVPT